MKTEHQNYLTSAFFSISVLVVLWQNADVIVLIKIIQSAYCFILAYEVFNKFLFSRTVGHYWVQFSWPAINRGIVDFQLLWIKVPCLMFAYSSGSVFCGRVSSQLLCMSEFSRRRFFRGRVFHAQVFACSSLSVKGIAEYRAWQW